MFWIAPQRRCIKRRTCRLLVSECRHCEWNVGLGVSAVVVSEMRLVCWSSLPAGRPTALVPVQKDCTTCDPAGLATELQFANRTLFVTQRVVKI
uniref:Uncharacterized protein n=1 Tax=Timema monikensis TaxID=170555 RepID=A0A7R9E943_9NEOP|nr:unnamed protein product [Timema monikensis]